MAVFGGESYRPSSYYRDVWLLDITHLQEQRTAADQSALEQRAFDFAASLPAAAESSRSWLSSLGLLVLALTALLVCLRARSARGKEKRVD